MTNAEQSYVESYCDVIRAVSDVNSYVTSAHRRHLDSMEVELGEERVEQLKEIARRKMY